MDELIIVLKYSLLCIGGKGFLKLAKSLKVADLLFSMFC